jgi:hypothetical protein
VPGEGWNSWRCEEKGCVFTRKTVRIADVSPSGNETRQLFSGRGDNTMKKVKIAFWVILIGFFVLVVFQNQAFFMAKQSFLINLYFKKYYTAETFNAVIMLALFLCGFLIAYFSGLAERFNLARRSRP